MSNPAEPDRTTGGPDDEPAAVVLSAQQWRGLEAAHAQRVDNLTAGHRDRRAAHRVHPVEDFLFTYYTLRPAQLRRWHPGAHVVLADAADRTGWSFYRPQSHHDASGGRGTAATVDIPAFCAARGPTLAYLRRLLSSTASAPPQFGCFGLHEWAMVFASTERRHDGPLRLGRSGTDEVVRSHQLRCSHFDAFRFFTPAARPLNLLAPDSQSRIRMEQPGCLHASMDLYKWAYKLLPVIPSALLLDCFLLARDIRTIDMMASPYDLTDLGYQPIKIETPEGKAQYVAAQREFAELGQQLRVRLLAIVDATISPAGPLDGPAVPDSRTPGTAHRPP